MAAGPKKRDPERTRRALLDAAAAAVAQHGAGVSLDAVARTAGVSKSGLLHHFSSKEDLFVALASDAYERFGREVEEAIDPADLAPGRLLRGYLRASFADLEAAGEAPDYWSVQAQLSTVPAVLESARRDYADWESRLSADGIDPGVARLVLLAATGADLLGTVGVPLGATNAQLLEGLVNLTRRPEAVAGLLAGDSIGNAESAKMP